MSVTLRMWTTGGIGGKYGTDWAGGLDINPYQTPFPEQLEVYCKLLLMQACRALDFPGSALPPYMTTHWQCFESAPVRAALPVVTAPRGLIEYPALLTNEERQDLKNRWAEIWAATS